MEQEEIDPIYELIVNQIKSIDRNDLSDQVDQKPQSKEIEKQMVYIWIRLYLKEESPNIKEGDDFVIKYTLSGEELKTKFICYGKKNSIKDSELQNQIQMTTEDDSKILCLMVSEDTIQNDDTIPFIRTLFKISKHFTPQVYNREDLIFTNKRTGEIFEYIDCDF
jgi:hypothetical protein